VPYRYHHHQWHEETDPPPFLPPMPSHRYNAYKFTFNRELVETCHHLIALVPCIIMVITSMYISYAYSCNRWTAIVEFCGNTFLVACDALALFLLRFPKLLIFTLFLICTIVACAVQCVGNYVWCQHLDWTHENVFLYLPYILLAPYCVKLFFLFILLRVNFITLQSTLLMDFDRHTLFYFPMQLTYFTPKSIFTIDYRSGNLLVLTLLTAVLDETVLRRRNEVLIGDDNTSYYDENMEATVMCTAVKQSLYRCKAELKKKQVEYEGALQKFDRIKKSYSEVKNERDELKKQLDGQNKQNDILNRDLGKANNVVADLRKQLSKQQGNAYCCCICQDRMKTILLRPCNHLSVCEKCLKGVLARRDKVCPLCREKIEGHIKVFL